MRYPFAKYYLPLLLMTALLIIAVGVRFHNLGVQSLWYDEGVAFGHSQRTLLELIPALRANVHVPAYFGTLALWEDFVGSTEFGLRAYSALWSLLGVAATYALGKRLYSPIAGLAATAFVSLNTFSIYYAQETRMYAMLATIGALSMWAFVGFIVGALRVAPSTKIRFRWALAFALLNAVGIYTHFSYALVLLAQGVLALLALGNLAYRAIVARIPPPVFGREFLIYFAANLLTLLLFAPWLPTALSQVSAQPNISAVLSSAEMLRLIQGWLAYGRTFETSLGGMSAVVYFLLVFGLLVPSDSQPRAWWRMLVPVGWVLLSVAVYGYLELYARYLRFLLPVQIAFALWMGRGVWMLWHIVQRTTRDNHASLTRYVPKVAAVVAVVAFSYTLAQGIPPLYHDDRYQRDDYRHLAQVIEQEGQVGDAIILNAPGLQEIFGYYYDGDLRVYPLPASDDTIGDTTAIIAEHDRIFVVLYGADEQDPNGLVTGTLNQAAYQINAEWIDNILLERYAAPAQFDNVQTVNTRFGDHITLETYALSDTTLHPNDALQVQLQWTTDAPLDTHYKVFVQLLNPDGTLAAQRDSEPGGGQAITTLWQPDTLVVDNHALALPANLAPGDYTLIIGLYDANNPAARLPVGANDFLTLGTITVE